MLIVELLLFGTCFGWFGADAAFAKETRRTRAPDRIANETNWRPTNKQSDQSGFESFKTSPSRSRRAATANIDNLWTDGIVPYEIDYNYSGILLHMIHQSMYMWMEGTCVYFTERNNWDQSWLYVTPGACGCCSQVGRQTLGPQYIHLTEECDKPGIMAHEFGHALGFWHEHTRPDRDDHIYIVEENIESEQRYNFVKKSYDDVDPLGEPYDPLSIMHYAPNTFVKKGADFTILLRYQSHIAQTDDEFVDAMSNLGQRRKPSEGDIIQLNKLYRCPPCGGNVFLSDPGKWSLIEPRESIVHCKYCRWILSVSPGSRVQLKIDQIHLYPGQFGIIYDGHERNHRLIGYINGAQQMFRPSLLSVRRSVLIELWGSTVIDNTDADSTFRLSARAVCGGSIVKWRGSISNPGYPKPVLNTSISCKWIISTTSNRMITLLLRRVIMKDEGEKTSASLSIYDGSSDEAPLIHKLQNFEIGDSPLSIQSRTSSMQLHLEVDNYSYGLMWAEHSAGHNPCSQRNGDCQQICFVVDSSSRCACDIGYRLATDRRSCKTVASISEIIRQMKELQEEASCRRIIYLSTNNNHGMIRSPISPSNKETYSNNLDCSWQLIAPMTRKILFNFTMMEIEGMPGSCFYDRLKFEEHDKEHNSKITQELCGNRIPDAFRSISNRVNISFTTDDSNRGRGFVVHFTMVQ